MHRDVRMRPFLEEEVLAIEKCAPAPLVIERRVRVLGIAFFFLMSAQFAVQLLQTTVNANLGFYCSVASYACFAISSTLIAPRVVARAGPRWCVAIAALPYVAVQTLNITPPHPALFLSACAALGLAAGPLWVAAAVYIGEAAAAYARASACPLTDAASHLDVIFYAHFQFACCAGSSLAALLQLADGDGDRTLLFATLAGVGALGAFCFCFLVAPASPGNAFLRIPLLTMRPSASTDGTAVASLGPPSAPSTSPTHFFRFLHASKPSILPLLPLFACMGAFQALFFATLTGAVIAPTMGSTRVGLAGVVYAAAAALTVLALPCAVKRPHVGRRWALAVAGTLWLASLAGLVAWLSVFPTTFGAGGPAAAPVIFALVGALGAGDGAFTALMSATLQVWWRNDVASSNAALRLMMALGTALMSGAGAGITVRVQVCALAGSFCVAAVLLAREHARHGIDGRPGGGQNDDLTNADTNNDTSQLLSRSSSDSDGRA